MPMNIAIDGPVGAGKSSIADQVAQRLHILHLDTGAMYRTVALYMLRTGSIRRMSRRSPRAAARRMCAWRIGTARSGRCWAGRT